MSSLVLFFDKSPFALRMRLEFDKSVIFSKILTSASVITFFSGQNVLSLEGSKLIVSSVSKGLLAISMGNKFTDPKYLLMSLIRTVVEGKKK